MTTLDQATQKTNLIIEKIIDKLKMKYDNIDFNKSDTKNPFYVRCSYNKGSENKTKNITIHFIPDYQRRNPKFPNNINDYQNGGGHKGLEELFKNMSKNAWKCEIYSDISTGTKMYYGININENNFNEEKVLKVFQEYLLEK